jgi:hypothetical protein
VFVVGVSGGVPHYTDYFKHVRLGDIVISFCNEKGYFYYYCEKMFKDKEGQLIHQLKTWAPRDLILQRVVERIQGHQRKLTGGGMYGGGGGVRGQLFQRQNMSHRWKRTGGGMYGGGGRESVWGQGGDWGEWKRLRPCTT